MADTVYVTGAGLNQCVQDWGGLRPPLATNFFQTALQSPKYYSDFYLRRIRPVYEYIERFWRKSRVQLESDPLDLEEVFTLLEMQADDAERSREREEYAHLRNIEFLLKSFLADFLTHFNIHVIGIENYPLVSQFGNMLYKEKPVILSFNYDCILERIIEHASGVRTEIPLSYHTPGTINRVTDEELSYSHFNWNMPLAYGVGFAEVQLRRAGLRTFVDGPRFYGHSKNVLYSWPILKLHGSLNWFRYLPIRKYPALYPAQRELPQEKSGAVVLVEGDWWFAEPPDRDGWLLDPVMITPVLNKQRYLMHPLLSDLWKRALSELSTCKRLVVIGYSFPPTDFNTRRLFLEAFQSTCPEEVIVVNPDTRVAELVKALCHFTKGITTYRSLDEFVTGSLPAPLDTSSS